MVCPNCLNSQTQVYNSRHVKKNNSTWRRRRCKICNFTFTTIESLDLSSFIKIKKNNKLEPYSKAKLSLSIANSCRHLDNSNEATFYLLDTIEKEILHTKKEGIISVSVIVKICLRILKHYNTRAFLRYITEHPEIQDENDFKKLL